MLSEPYRLVAINFPSEERNEKSRVNMRLRIEYGPEGGGDPKAIEVHAVGDFRELTYEAMDEVLKADISEAELTAITRLLDSAHLAPDHILYRLADAISLSYESGRDQRKFFGGEMGSDQFDALLKIWAELERLASCYFIPRFY
jgi:hypothetical protein